MDRFSRSSTSRGKPSVLYIYIYMYISSSLARQPSGVEEACSGCFLVSSVNRLSGCGADVPGAMTRNPRVKSQDPGARIHDTGIISQESGARSYIGRGETSSTTPGADGFA